MKINNKGTMLIATYLVLFIIIVVASSLCTFVITEQKSIARESGGKKALGYAEMGVAYAYYESQNYGWQWYTHKWNNDEDKLLKLAPGDSSYGQLLRADCSFDANGYYQSNDGKFMVKAYPNRDDEDETVIVAMGIEGENRRVITYTLSRQGIYDFFFYSPYDMDLDNEVGNFPKLYGGGIHTNGNIRIDNPVRLENISELSAGENGVIYYAASDQYPAPYYADNYDGVKDGMAPMVRLDRPNDIFRDDAKDNPGDFGYYYWDKYGDRHWNYQSNASYFGSTSTWLTSAFRSTEWYFYGDMLDYNNINPGNRDNRVSSSIINDSSEPLNGYNTWVKPYLGETDCGDIISGEWTQIPAEMDQTWDWSKYKGDAYGYRSGAGEQPLHFYTYDNDGNKVNVENTYWEITGGGHHTPVSVEMVDPAKLDEHPQAKSYWDMFKDPRYWTAIGKDLSGSEDWPDNMSEDIKDGTYGSERASGGKIPVKHTNSEKQPDAWDSFLKKSKLDGIVRDGNTGGEYLAPPEFDITYARMAERSGLLINLADDFDGKYNDYEEWMKVLEKSIDKAVTELNDGTARPVASKVKFINTFTNQWNVVLEINLGRMQKEGKTPDNGIVYSQVPLRLTNAEKLPRKMDSYGFTVLGEENIYLQGNFNTDEWVTSAIIGKKRIFTLSDDFNDPQIVPATEHYRDYPYLYVKKDEGSGIYEEANPDAGGGQWVYRDYLNYLTYDRYTNIDDANEQQLKDLIDKKDGTYRAMFNKHDPTGTASATFSWPDSGENYTYGMMPNRVYDNYTFNTLIACYRGTKGDNLENWNNGSKDMKKYLNGAYFVLDKDGEFTAPTGDFVDYESGLGTSSRGRYVSGTVYYGTKSPPWSLNYDKRFQTATRSASDVFFGGAQSLWKEESCDFFYQENF
ncbi:MAG: hypothetical protein ABII88_10005 [Candidatus Omnitrophota bacterium]